MAATTQLPNGQPSGPALTVTIDDVVATEIAFGTIVPLKRLRSGEHLVRVFRLNYDGQGEPMCAFDVVLRRVGRTMR